MRYAQEPPSKHDIRDQGAQSVNEAVKHTHAQQLTEPTPKQPAADFETLYRTNTSIEAAEQLRKRYNGDKDTNVSEEEASKCVFNHKYRPQHASQRDFFLLEFNSSPSRAISYMHRYVLLITSPSLRAHTKVKPSQAKPSQTSQQAKKFINKRKRKKKRKCKE